MGSKSILAWLIPLAGLVQGVAAGQSGNVYLSIGGGSNAGAAFAQVASGGEFLAAQTVGFGGEVGIVDRHSSFGFVSLDVSFHFLRHPPIHNILMGKVEPFVIGGYTRTYNLFSGANGANFGGGFNIWLTRHFGVRAEFRDMVFSAGLPTANFLAIRGGIVFR